MFVIQVVNFELDREGIKKEKMVRGVGGDYSSKAIILNISVKGGRLFE